MNPIERLLISLKYDRVFKIVLVLAALYTAVLYSYSYSILAILLVSSLIAVSLVYWQQQLLMQLQTLAPQAYSEELVSSLHHKFTRGLFATAASNPLLLVIYYLLYYYYQGEGLPQLSTEEYFTYAAFAFFTYALSFYIGRSQLQKAIIDLRVENGKLSKAELQEYRQKTRKKQLWRIVPMLILVIALSILLFSHYYIG